MKSFLSIFSRAMRPRRVSPLRAVLAFWLLVMTPFAVAGCGSSAAKARSTLRLPLYGWPSSPDPALVNGESERLLAGMLYSGLVKFSPDLHVIPDLAVSIPTISLDGRSYVFTIRQDARFTDGSHCRASDVAFSLSRALSPDVDSAPARKLLGNIVGARQVEQGRTAQLSGVHVIDSMTLRIRLQRPDASFLEKLAMPAAMVVEERAVRTDRQLRWDDLAAGTGPWRITRNRGRVLDLAPRPHYYGGQIQVSSIQLVAVRSFEDGLRRYHDGTIDAAQVPVDRIAAYAQHTDYSSTTGMDAYYAVGPRELSARLAAVLDRNRLNAAIQPDLNGMESIVPASVPDYVASPPIEQPAADPPAIQLLAPRGDPGAALVRRALSQQWPVRPHGIPITLVHVWRGLPDPIAWLRLALPYTHSHWYRNLLKNASQLTNDPVSRMSEYSNGEQWALQEGLMIPLASGVQAYLIKEPVHGLQVTPLGLMPANNIWTGLTLQ